MRFYWPIAKVDGGQRMVWGYASTAAEDDQGETVSRDALAAALDDYMRFANIREMHQNSAVGVAREAGIDEKGLYIGAKIVDDDAWRKVVEGVYKGFSIGGRVTARDPFDPSMITGLMLTEISVVDRPANPEAVFDCWKLAAGAAAAVEGDGAAGASDGFVDYADPGYQPDGRKRYPLDSERHIRAAWAFIHMPQNARAYTAPQLMRLKARIIAAWQAEIDPAGPPATAPGSGSARKQARPAVAGRLRQIIAALCDLLAQLGDDAEAAPGGGTGPGGADLAALAPSDLRKTRDPDPAPIGAGLARLADEIMPRLEALQQQVDAIARTPLPPQTAARGIAKAHDGGVTPASSDDIVAALARMSEEDRTLTLIKAAHQNPIIAGVRPTGAAR